jgi:hypothetical protein
MVDWEIAFLYQNRSATARLSIDALRTKTLLQLYEIARPLLSIDLPPDALYIDLATSDRSDVSELTDKPVDADFILECPVLSFLSKSDYSTFSSFLHEVFPSALGASTSFGEFQEAFIATINTAQAVHEAASLPANFEVLKKLIPPSLFQTTPVRVQVDTLLNWYLGRRFITEDSVHFCSCDSDNHRPISVFGCPKQFTQEEMENGAVDVDMYECSQCGSRERDVIYLNPATIIERHKGRSRENCLLFACALAALELTYRIVTVVDRPFMWCEVWIDDRFVMFDPTDRLVDDREEPPSWVIALGQYECVDVTAKYVLDPATVVTQRSAKIPESLFQKVIGLRDSMLRSSASPEVVNGVNDRQNSDMLSWELGRAVVPESGSRCSIL